MQKKTRNPSDALEMKKIREFLENETLRDFLTILKVFIIVVASYLYLMYADLSTAPEFIYNQF